VITYEWRGTFANDEWHVLHAQAFETRVFDDDWVSLTATHSMGWVVARDEEANLMGFVNVVWDGLVHAWIQDVMVSTSARGRGVATDMVAVVQRHAGAAGLEWLHVDFDDELRGFYFDRCGFTPTNAGLIAL